MCMVCVGIMLIDTMKLLTYSKRLMIIKEFCNGCRDLNYPSTLSSLKFCPDVHTYAHTHRDTHINTHVYIYIYA